MPQKQPLANVPNCGLSDADEAMLRACCANEVVGWVGGSSGALGAEERSEAKRRASISVRARRRTCVGERRRDRVGERWWW